MPLRAFPKARNLYLGQCERKLEGQGVFMAFTTPGNPNTSRKRNTLEEVFKKRDKKSFRGLLVPGIDVRRVKATKPNSVSIYLWVLHHEAFFHALGAERLLGLTSKTLQELRLLAIYASPNSAHIRMTPMQERSKSTPASAAVWCCVNSKSLFLGARCNGFSCRLTSCIVLRIDWYVTPPFKTLSSHIWTSVRGQGSIYGPAERLSRNWNG